MRIHVFQMSIEAFSPSGIFEKTFISPSLPCRQIVATGNYSQKAHELIASALRLPVVAYGQDLSFSIKNRIHMRSQKQTERVIKDRCLGTAIKTLRQYYRLRLCIFVFIWSNSHPNFQKMPFNHFRDYQEQGAKPLQEWCCIY